MKLSKLIPNFNRELFVLQFFNALKLGLPLIISVIIVRLNGDSIFINQYESITLVGSSLSFFYVSGFGYTILPFLGKIAQLDFKSHITAIHSITALFSIVFSCLIILVLYWIIPEIGIYLAIKIGIFYFFFSLSSNLEYILIYKKQFHKLIFIGLIFTIIHVLLFFVYVPSSNFQALFNGMILLYALRFLLSYFTEAFSYFKTDFTLVKKFFHYCNPVMLSLIFGTGYAYLVHYMVRNQASIQDFNIFRYGLREFPLIILLANSFSIFLSQYLSQHLHQWDTNYIKQKLKMLTHQSFIIAIILSLISPYIFTWVYGKAFLNSAYIFNILLLSVVARLLFPQCFLMALSKTKYSFYASVIESIIGLILSAIFIYFWGIYGAAWALFFGLLAEKICLLYYLKKKKIKYLEYMPSRIHVLYSIILIGIVITQLIV